MVEVDKGFKPVCRDKARVASDKECSEIGVTYFEMVKIYFDGGRGDDVSDSD